MKLYCRDGIVVATHDDNQDVPASAYGDGVVILTSTASLSPGDPAPAIDSAALLAYARQKRVEIIGAGCVVSVNGTPISVWADTATQAAITALSVVASQNPSFTTRWKARDGQFFDLNASDIAALAHGILTFVQEAFAIEADIAIHVADASITELGQIDDAEWPSNS